MSTSPELIVINARVYTCDSLSPWAEAVAVSHGTITAVGTTLEIGALATSATEVVDAAGRMLMPGLTDIHAHLMFGGTRMAWELSLQPDDGLPDILTKVAARARTAATGEWIIGGIVGSPVLDQLASGGYLAALDAAAGGRPVLLRDDSYHNRWVNSKAFELMGVGHTTPDPPGGTIVRDRDGNLTGVLYESACTLAERAAATSVGNPAARDRQSIRTAIELMNSFGITAIQDAATLEPSLRALSELDDEDGLTAWVVGTLPVRPYMSDDIVGDELFDAAADYRRHQIRPDFAKFFLDGVPMTRTSALLEPYICHGAHEDPTDTGSLLWTDADLVAALEHCHEVGLGAKLHATGDRSVRQALDAIQALRERHGNRTPYHIAHVPFVSPSDLPRFTELAVVAEASPYIWFPTPMLTSLNTQIPPSLADRSWPFRELLDHNAQLAVGSDWPIAPTPDPWMAMEALITRANPDPNHAGSNNPAEGITLREAISAFTHANANAMGMGDTIGMLTPGRSADFIIVNDNLFDVETGAIHQTKVRQTYFRGQRVHGSAL
ncbi:amidohydrolase [Mycobacterium sp. NPDC003449]